MKTKSACAYYKISDVSPNKTSLEDQRRMIKDLADSREIEIIADVTEVTGSKKIGRPAFEQMYKSAVSKSHPYDAIVVSSLELLPKSAKGNNMMRELLDNNIDIISFQEGDSGKTNIRLLLTPVAIEKPIRRKTKFRMFLEQVFLKK